MSGSGDVDILSSQLVADAQSYLSTMQQVVQESEKAIAAMQEAAGAAKETGSAADEAGGIAEGFGEALAGVAAVAAGAVGAIVAFGAAAIAANNAVNPQAAQQWNQSTRELEDSLTRLAASVGSKIEPTIIGFIQGATTFFTKLQGTDFGPLVSGLEEVGGKLVSFGKTLLGILVAPYKALYEAVGGVVNQIIGFFNQFKDQLAPVLDALQKILVQPWIDLVTYAIGALSSVTQAAAKAQGFLNVGDGGAGLNAMSKQLDDLNNKIKTQGLGKTLVDGVKAGAVAVKDFLQPVLDGAAKTLDSYKGASGKGKRVTTAEDVQREQGGQNRIDEAANYYERTMGRANDKLLKAHLEAMNLDVASAQSQIKLGDQKFEQAQQAYQQAQETGNGAGMAKALADMKAAAAAVQASFDKAGQDLDAGIGEVSTQLAAAQAKANTDAGAAASAEAQRIQDLNDLKVEGLAPVRKAELEADQEAMQRVIQRASIEAQLVTQLEAQKAQLEKQRIDNTTAAQEDAQKHLAALQKIANQETKFFYDSIMSTMKGALGSVGGGALEAGQKGFAASGGNPLAAAGAAGLSLLQNSAGFKAMSTAINTIFQSLADALGSVLGPITPVIKELGAVLTPLFQAVSSVLTPIGQVAAEVIAPFVTVIQAVIAPIEAVLQPLGDLIQALAPLVGPIEEITMLIFIVTNLLDPFTIALMLLSPLLDQAAKILQVLVNDLALVWNKMIDAIENFFRGLDQLPLIGGAMDTVANALDGLKMATMQTTATINQLNQAQQTQLQQIMSMIQQQTEQAAVDQGNVDALKQALDRAENPQYGQAKGSAADIAALQAALAQAEAQQQEDADAADVAYLQQILKTQTDNGVDTSDTVTALSYALAKQAKDQAAATNATSGLTKAVVALTAVLTNTPTGFFAATYERAAMGGGSSIAAAMMLAAKAWAAGGGKSAIRQSNASILKNNTGTVGRFA